MSWEGWSASDLVSWDRVKYFATTLAIASFLAVLTIVYTRARRWWWRRSINSEALNLKEFRFGKVRAKIKVLDAVLGNLRRGYHDDLVIFGAADPYNSVENNLQRERDEILRELLPKYVERREAWLRVAQEGGKHIWDSQDLLGFNKITISRDGEDEHNRIEVRVSRASYFDHRAISDCFKEMTNDEQVEVIEHHQYGSNVFGRLSAISAALITSEGKILFPRRSRMLTSDPGLITCGINEALKVSDAQQKGGLCVPKRAILRGLEEEFGVSLPTTLLDRVQLWALVLHTGPFEWYFYGTVDLRDCGEAYSAKTLEQNLVTGKARDKFENVSVAAVDFKLRSIVKFVERNRGELTEYGASLPILAALFDGQVSVPMLKRFRSLLPSRRVRQ